MLFKEHYNVGGDMKQKVSIAYGIWKREKKIPSSDIVLQKAELTSNKTRPHSV